MKAHKHSLQAEPEPPPAPLPPPLPPPLPEGIQRMGLRGKEREAASGAWSVTKRLLRSTTRRAGARLDRTSKQFQLLAPTKFHLARLAQDDASPAGTTVASDASATPPLVDAFP